MLNKSINIVALPIKMDAAKTNIVKSTKFALRTRPSLPEPGLHNVVIGELTNETGMENGAEINRIRLPVLGVKDSHGNPFTLDKVYNMGEHGRGLSALLKDYVTWSGIEVAREDVYGFDCNAAMSGQPVVVNVRYHVQGANVTAYIKSFHRPGYAGAEDEAMSVAQVADGAEA
jgi:hypothetical protein